MVYACSSNIVHIVARVRHQFCGQPAQHTRDIMYQSIFANIIFMTPEQDDDVQPHGHDILYAHPKI